MNEITQQKIFEKLQQLDGYLSNFKKLKKEMKSPEEFLEDFHLYGLAERYLQLSCQVVLDILNLVIIEEAWEKPEDNQEAVSILFGKKIISENLASNLEDIVGFRNILVHEYGKIDRRRVYQYLLEKLELFKVFKKEVLNWLKNKSL